MVGDLIMLPVRVGLRATRFWLRAAEETTSLAVNAAQQLAGLAGSRGSNGSGSSIASPRPSSDAFGASTQEPGASAARVAERPPPPVPNAETSPAAAAESALTIRPPTPPPPDRPAEPEPLHVSEEPALVEEFAEPGAEDGAGAEVHFEEPWDGYAHMNAKQILARVNSGTPAELAAVQLYETSHRGRQTILNAVERELRRANGHGTRSH
ncbi:MAG: hypothetical protein JO244_06080 [Solirubrobacterales bacterium]|nr:hypothetical protein [Solirubrobacterales bacterium]